MSLGVPRHIQHYTIELMANFILLQPSRNTDNAPTMINKTCIETNIRFVFEERIECEHYYIMNAFVKTHYSEGP
jgi:hypothetical protein